MADPEKQEIKANPDPAPAQQSSGAGGDIGLTMSYIISIPGILKIVEFFLLMIAFSLAADSRGWGLWYPGRMDFFLFVTVTSWLVVIAVFILFAFNVIAKINLSIDWNVLVMAFAAFVAVLLLISSSLIADAARWYSRADKLSAASAFGFFSMVAFICDAGFHFLRMQGKM